MMKLRILSQTSMAAPLSGIDQYFSLMLYFGMWTLIHARINVCILIKEPKDTIYIIWQVYHFDQRRMPDLAAYLD